MLSADPGTDNKQSKTFTIMLEILQSKFADEIKWYGITDVKKVNGDVIITSIERIPWDLYESIKLELA